MRCSACSAPVRPVVAIDLDGTLGDYHGHLDKFATQYLGRPGVGQYAYDGGEPYRDWFMRLYRCDVTTFREVKLAYRQGGMKRTQPVFNGARALAVGLVNAGAEVWITTTRPFARFDRVDPDTREWLRRHDIPFTALLASDHKMAELADRVDADRVVAVLDDQPDVLEEAAELFGPSSAILVQGLYNRLAPWEGPFVKGLVGDNGALPYVEQRLSAWFGIYNKEQ